MCGAYRHYPVMDDFLELFAQTSLLWGLGVLIIIAASYGLRAYLGYRTVAEEAPLDYAYRSGEGMLPKGLSEDSYVRAYKRYNAPRAPLHVALTISAIALLTLPALGLFNWVTFTLWVMNGKDEVFVPGLLVHSLLIYFLIIGFWALLAFLAARNYHGKAPISLEDEIQKEREV